MTASDVLLERLRAVLYPDFTVERLLGEGGMGSVFLGYDQQLKVRVAIKVLKPTMAIAELIQRFALEREILASINHPNIVRIYRAGEKDGLSYFVMEYLGEQNLDERKKEGPLPARDLRALGRDILNGLAEAHRRGVIHRDVKQSNIFLTGGRAVLTDFGIALLANPTDEKLTQPGQVSPGTPHYRSPEQAQPGGDVGPASDQYSAAVVLYEVGTGRDWDRAQDLRRVSWAGLPRVVARALKRALEWDPKARWRSADEFAHALTRWATPSQWMAILAPVILAAVLLFSRGHCWPTSLWSGCQDPVPHTDLALLPFKASISGSGPDGAEFAHTVTTNLNWFHRLRIATVRTVAEQVGARATDIVERSRLERLNSRFIANGLFVQDSSRWLVSLTVLDPRAELVALIKVPGSPERFLEWSCDVADSLIRRVFPERWQEYESLRPRSCATGNQQAYREFFRGDSAFQVDAYLAAQEHYEQALRDDPSFVMAAWQLALVRRFRRMPFEADLKQIYDRHQAELPSQYVRLIEAMLDPDLHSRFLRYRAVAAEYPGDGYVGFVQADEQFHRGPLVGVPIDTAVIGFRRAMSLDSTLHWMSALDHMLYGYLRLGMRPQSDSTLAARIGIPRTGEADDAARRAFFRLAYDERFLPALGNLKTFWLSFTIDSGMAERLNHFIRLGTSFDIPEAQVKLSALLTRTNRSPAIRSNGFRALGIGLMTRGRPAAALPMLDSAIALFGAPDSLVERAEWRVMLAAYGLPVIADSERQWALGTLDRLAAGPAGSLANRAAWALAADAYARGDTVAAGARASTVRGAPVRGLERLLTASAVAARGDYRQALDLTAPLLSYDTTAAVIDPFARSFLYLQRVAWSLALGDSTGADITRLWYQNSDSGIDGWPQFGLESSDVDNMLGVYARLLQGEADLARGRIATACPLLGRVREIWSGAEPALQALRDRADQAWQRCRP